MMDELGREMTSAERIAVATGETTIMDIVHGAALEMNAERDAEVAMTMPSGLVITRGELWDEIRRTERASRSLRATPSHSWHLGANASVGMFA